MVLEEIHGLGNSTKSKKSVGLCVGPVFSAAPTFLGKPPAPSFPFNVSKAQPGRTQERAGTASVSSMPGVQRSAAWGLCNLSLRLQWSTCHGNVRLAHVSSNQIVHMQIGCSTMPTLELMASTCMRLWLTLSSRRKAAAICICRAATEP